MIASLTGGALLFIARGIYQRELRTALRLPWRLSVGPLLLFVLYGLAWPWALGTSNPRQVYGVSLINYLWPVLTVLFSVALVPGVRLTPRMLLALALALSGLAFANLKQLSELSPNGTGSHGLSFRHLLPYGLALIAAFTWAAYSALLARWKSWSGNYVTSPLGFILIGLVAIPFAARESGPEPTALSTVLTLLYGAGPLAVGYLLWETALAHARVQTLSLLAAATPVLSTFLLCFFLETRPGPELVLAALLVSAGVVLSRKE
jgi:drug/metabolite transporter (DMT)-like permease